MRDSVYGFPCVEDPHDFRPDEECCTPQEIAFWEDAKRRRDAGERDVRGKRCETTTNENGEYTGHVTRTSWGIGTNSFDFEEDDLNPDGHVCYYHRLSCDEEKRCFVCQKLM